MSQLRVVARFAIPQGKVAAFKEAAVGCLEATRKDTGTLQYDWYLTADESQCVVLETFRDSAAFAEHVANMAEAMPVITAIAPLQLEVYGNPTDELREVLAALGPTLYRPLQSL